MQINNSALRITGVCQPASFQRNRRGYKNPESFCRTPRASRRQSRVGKELGASVRRCPRRRLAGGLSKLGEVGTRCPRGPGVGGDDTVPWGPGWGRVKRHTAEGQLEPRAAARAGPSA